MIKELFSNGLFRKTCSCAGCSMASERAIERAVAQEESLIKERDELSASLQAERELRQGEVDELREKLEEAEDRLKDAEMERDQLRDAFITSSLYH